MELLLPRPLTANLTMDGNHAWLSAYFPHPYAYWRQQRQPGAVGTGAPPPPGMGPCLAASTGTLPQRPPLQQHPQLRAPGAAARVGRSLLSTRTMTARAPAPAVSGPPRRGYLQVRNFLHPRTFVCRRPQMSPCRQGFSHLLRQMSTARFLGFVRSTARCDFVSMMHSLAFAMTARCGLTAGVLCRRRQVDTPLSLLTSILIRSQLRCS